MRTETDKIKVHPKWLSFMYIVNIFGAMGLGIVYLVSPSTVTSLMGVPNLNPMWSPGYAYSYMVALGVIGLMGLRSPLKFAVSLLLQATGKIIWIAAVFAPALVSGSVPPWGYEITMLFVFWIAGDLIVIPWRHFLSK